MAADFNSVSELSNCGLLGAGGGPDFLAELLSSIDGFQGTGDHLLGADPHGFIGQPVLEKLGIGQDDAQLVVEAVE